jgi:hypothetical protein
MTTNDEERLRKERAIESLKLEFEMHKHFTTVLAALGVVILTIVQGFFAVGKHNRPYSFWENFFLIGCFVFFFFGGLCSISAMQIVFQQVRDPEGVGTENRRHRYQRYVRAIIPGATLLGGVVFFGVFVGVYMWTRR